MYVSFPATQILAAGHAEIVSQRLRSLHDEPQIEELDYNLP